VDFVFVSDAAYRSIVPFLCCGKVMPVEQDCTIDYLDAFVQSISPLMIICGATRYVSIDRFLIKVAQRRKIPSTVVLDEWYYYRRRFQNEQGELEYLPERVAIMDEYAYREAASEGVDKRLLKVTGSPALTDLLNTIKDYCASPPSLPDFLAQRMNAAVITYISEEFKADYSDHNDGSAKLGSYQGYDEDTVLSDILQILASIDREFILVEKLHPSSLKTVGWKQTSGSRIAHYAVKDCPLHAILWHSKLVIGMRSIALLEAAMMCKHSVSYQPNLRFENLCTAVKLGLVPFTQDKNSLRSWIEETVCMPEKEFKGIDYPFVRNDVFEAILGA